jgi:cell division protein ZapA
MERNSVTVNILGSEYALKSEAEPQYLQELATFLDKKMQKLGEGTNVGSQLKIAVLTALNLADELFRLKEKHEKLVTEIENTSDQISENLDNYLNRITKLP